jgi:nitrite transporter
MYSDTINRCAAIAARIQRTSNDSPLAFWIGCLMAGAYVGLGIILIFTLGNLLEPALRPLVMGATFGIALTLVIIAGAELFTGHSMFLTFGVKCGQLNSRQASGLLLQSWLGNLLGSVAIAALFWAAGGGTLLADNSSLLHSVALAKTTAPALVLLAKGVLCNYLVCLAIWMCQRVDGAARFIAIWWCLLAFIASGYEHSIANMTLLALSWFGQHSSDYSLTGIGHNLLWVTLGNLISGIVLMGLGYWHATPAHQRPQQAVAAKADAPINSTPNNPQALAGSH